MSIGNLIRKNNKFEKEYTAEVVSNADELQRGRVQVKIPTLMGDIPFWVDSTLVTGSVNFLMVPDSGDKVNVTFRNKDIYSGEWSLDSSPNNTANINPNKYGLKDSNGNIIIVDKVENTINIESQDVVTIKAKNTLNIESTTINIKAEDINIDSTTMTINSDTTKLTGTTLETTNDTTAINGVTSINGNTTIAGLLIATDAQIESGATYRAASQVKAYMGIVKANVP